MKLFVLALKGYLTFKKLNKLGLVKKQYTFKNIYNALKGKEVLK